MVIELFFAVALVCSPEKETQCKLYKGPLLFTDVVHCENYLMGPRGLLGIRENLWNPVTKRMEDPSGNKVILSDFKCVKIEQRIPDGDPA